jgi:tetratricopeptide (TPR) repeat protein
LGKLDRAIFHIDRSIHLNPHYADAYRSLGDAYLNSGNADLSLEAYQKALLLNPKDPDTLLNFWQRPSPFGSVPRSSDRISQDCRSIALQPESLE